jgi:hypothetical protein
MMCSAKCWPQNVPSLPHVLSWRRRRQRKVEAGRGEAERGGDGAETVQI